MTIRTSQIGFTLFAVGVAISIIALALLGSAALARFMPRRSSCNMPGCASPSLQANVAILRSAIWLYGEEHGGAKPSLAEISAQLTMYSDASGASTQASKDDEHPLGPYVRSVPNLPVGVRKGMSGISDSDGPGIGWIYDQAKGAIRANTKTEVDDGGRLYSDY